VDLWEASLHFVKTLAWIYDNLNLGGIIMSISLEKGQRISLTKGNAELDKIMVGLGWDPVSSGGNFFGKLFNKVSDIDIDASVFMLETNDRLSKKRDLIYYGNLKSKHKSVVHQGDNLTGAGEGDDESIKLHLSKIPERIKKLVFVVNIYDCIRRKQNFGMVENAFIRIKDLEKGSELLRFNLTDQYKGKTAVFVAEIYRDNDDWKFAAIGEGTDHTNLTEMKQRYM